MGSTAAATALNRQTHEILPVAETVVSLARLFCPKGRYPAEDFWGAWQNVMFPYRLNAFTTVRLVASAASLP